MTIKQIKEMRDHFICDEEKFFHLIERPCQGGYFEFGVSFCSKYSKDDRWTAKFYYNGGGHHATAVRKREGRGYNHIEAIRALLRQLPDHFIVAMFGHRY